MSIEIFKLLTKISQRYQKKIILLLRAEEVIKASDEERCDHFRFIIPQEGLNHPPRDWESARELYKTLVNTTLF